GSEGRDVERVVVETRKGRGELVVAEQAGCVVADQSALLQSSEMPFEGDGVIHSTKIQARHFEGHSRADASLALRNILTGGGLPGLHFESKSVIKGVALGFADVDQHVLGGILTVGVLYRRVDLAENPEVIE